MIFHEIEVYSTMSFKVTSEILQPEKKCNLSDFQFFYAVVFQHFT